MFPGGTISGVTLDSESKVLRMKASFTPDKEIGLAESYLTVVIPKMVLDSHVDNKMNDFTITVNGVPVSYEGSSDDIERGVKIRITGDSEIEIIGTSAIPEFGLSMVVFLIFSTILVSITTLYHRLFKQNKLL
jgi:hypothetical protein